MQGHRCQQLLQRAGSDKHQAALARPAGADRQGRGRGQLYSLAQGLHICCKQVPRTLVKHAHSSLGVQYINPLSCWLPICRCLLQPESGAARQEVAWLCAAAGRKLVGRPETTDRLLSQDLVVVNRSQGHPRRQWAWDPFVHVLAASGVSTGPTSGVSGRGGGRPWVYPKPFVNRALRA